MPDGLLTTRTFDTIEPALAWVHEHNVERRSNLHFTVNPLRGIITKKPKKTDIAAVAFVHGDLDPRDDEEPEAAKARYLAALSAIPPSSAVIDSGNGIQTLTRLAEPITLGEPVTKPDGKVAFSQEDMAKIAEVEARSSAIMLAVGGEDGTQNIDRLLRLPGTINYPNAVKIAKGRSIMLTGLIALNDGVSALADFPSASTARTSPWSTIVDVPEELQEAVDKSTGQGVSTAPNDLIEGGIAGIVAMLAVINPDIKRAKWIAVGYILFRLLGSEQGFKFWDGWSCRGTKYRSREMEGQWRSIINGSYGWSPGTLIDLANAHDPQWRAKIAAKVEESQRDVEAEAQNEEAEAQAYKQAEEKPEPLPPPQRDVEAEAEAKTAEPVKKQTQSNGPKVQWHGEAKTEAAAPALIKGLIKQVSVNLLSGQWGTFKTFVILDIAGDVILGLPFIDYRLKRKGGVLFIAAEGGGSIPLRLQAMINKKLGLPPMEDAPPQPFAWINCQPNFFRAGSGPMIKLTQEVAATMQERFGCELVMIVVDTMAAAAGWSDEDDAAQTQTVMNSLWSLAEETDTAVFAVDHFGKDGKVGTRGSSAKEGAADSILALFGDREPTGKMTNLRLGIRKVKDGETGREIPFDFEVIDFGVDEDNDQVTSCIINWHPDRRIEKKVGGRPPKYMEIFNEAVSAAFAAHSETILLNGKEVRMVKQDWGRELFKEQTEGEPKTVAERWRTQLRAAERAGRLRLYRLNGVDYLWWPEQPM